MKLSSLVNKAAALKTNRQSISKAFLNNVQCSMNVNNMSALNERAREQPVEIRQRRISTKIAFRDSSKGALLSRRCLREIPSDAAEAAVASQSSLR